MIHTPVDFTSYEWGDVYVKDISEDGVTLFQQQCLISGITRRGYSDVKLDWDMNAETFEKDLFPGFPQYNEGNLICQFCNADIETETAEIKCNAETQFLK